MTMWCIGQYLVQIENQGYLKPSVGTSVVSNYDLHLQILGASYQQKSLTSVSILFSPDEMITGPDIIVL
jgi:hypothetical protein